MNANQDRIEAESLHAIALRHHQEGRLIRAVALYRRALAQWPRFPEAEVNLGTALQMQGEFYGAAFHFRRAIAQKPDLAEAHFNLGNVTAALGQDPEPSYRAALAVRSDYPDAAYNLALTLEAKGHFTEAEQRYRSAIASRRDYAEAYMNLGVLLLRDKRHLEALEVFDKALALRPRWAAAQNNRGNALLAMGAQERALEAYYEAAAWEPTLAEAHNHIANALRAQGRLAEAAESYRKVAMVAPEFPDIEYHLGHVLMEIGLMDDAFSHLTRHARRVCGPQAHSDLAHKIEHDSEQRAFLGKEKPDPLAELWLEGGNRLTEAAVQKHFDVEGRWSSANPVVVVDDFLTKDALEQLRRFCWNSTIWREIYAGGYLGAFPEHGLACPLLAQIAEELKAAYPAIFQDHPLLQIWAFKYSPNLHGIPLHADFAAINVNFWITPDEANTNPSTGGLVLWDKPAPPAWDFAKYNADPIAAKEFLQHHCAKSVTIPYRSNRAVIFDSDLFHETDSIAFAPGFCNRRINITLLYGRRRGAP